MKKQKKLQKIVENYFGETRSYDIWNDALDEYDALIPHSYGESKGRTDNLVNNIYPMIALYRAIQKNNVDKEEALKSMFDIMREKTTNGIRKQYKFFGKTPLIFPLIRFMFGQGLKGDSWKVHFIESNKENFRYDIKECLWAQACSKEGCPELCQIFCRNDEINFVDISKYMKFHRTKTIGNGDDICDFHFSRH